MEFRVVETPGVDTTTPPEFLMLPPVPELGPEDRTRGLLLAEQMSEYFPDAPVAALLGTVEDGIGTPLAWEDPVTENPAVGDTEMWELYNTTGDAHPIHVHEVAFHVVNRQPLAMDPVTGQLTPTGAPRGPEPWETGVKDTVIAYPEEVTRIRIHFETPGQFVWHCHIVEHEDNEMMRPYRIGPCQPGQPDPCPP